MKIFLTTALLAVLAATAAAAAPAARNAAPRGAAPTASAEIPYAPPPPLPPIDTRPPQAQANIDLTGYWVSVVTEDWRFRMVTPPKLDYTSLPISAEGKKIADAWDQEKDRAAGLECMAYGAAGLMRLPGRLHITWKDDHTLRVEADAGTQVREFPFGVLPKVAPNVPDAERTWQGRSVAQWYRDTPVGSGLEVLTIPTPPPSRTLKVVTTAMRPGYLRKNGVPYSAETMLTEYYDIVSHDGTDWLVITTVVDDPKYLQQPFITTTHFKRERDGAKWAPTPCLLEAPLRGPRLAYPQ